MKLRTRMFAGVAGSALIAGTMLFGTSPAGATTPGTYDWNTKCESVALSLSVGTAIGVVGGGTGGASSTYTARGYCGMYVDNDADGDVDGNDFAGTEVVQLPNGMEADGLQEVNRRDQWNLFHDDLAAVHARIVGNFHNEDLGTLVANKVVNAFVAQNNALFPGLPTREQGTQIYVNWWTPLTGQLKLPTTTDLEDGRTVQIMHTIQPNTGAMWSTDDSYFANEWSGKGYAKVVNDTAIFAAGCASGRNGGQDGGASATVYTTSWKAIMAAGCNITVANSEGGLTVLGGIGMSYKAHVVGAAAA